MEEQQTARQTLYTTKPYIRGHKNLLFNNQNNYYDFHKDEFQQLNCKQFFFFFYKSVVMFNLICCLGTYKHWFLLYSKWTEGRSLWLIYLVINYSKPGLCNPKGFSYREKSQLVAPSRIQVITDFTIIYRSAQNNYTPSNTINHRYWGHSIN